MSSSILKMVGYWNNFEAYHEDKYIWPQELVQDKPVENFDKIAKYLETGIPAIYWKGYSACRICGKTLGTKCLTDGTWIWPEKLEHYILEHNVRLPEEFIDHMKRCRWMIVRFKIANYDKIEVKSQLSNH